MLQLELPALQRPDGLFHNVVDDPASFPETNLPQMAAYTIYRGVREGWLNRSLLPWAHDLRRAAEERVDELGFVTGVCGAPRFDAPGIAPEGQAFFLMMEMAIALSVSRRIHSRNREPDLWGEVADPLADD